MRQWALATAVGLMAYACGGDIDRRDEEGQDPATAVERYELVFLDEVEEPDTARQAVQPDTEPSETSNELRRTPVSGTRETKDPQGVVHPEKPESATESVADIQPKLSVDSSADTDPAPTAHPVVMHSDGAFVVQIGSYSDRASAEKLVQELKNEGYPAFSIPGPQRRTYRVRIGFFRSRTDAERFGAIFKADHGMNFWVDRRQNDE